MQRIVLGTARDSGFSDLPYRRSAVLRFLGMELVLRWTRRGFVYSGIVCPQCGDSIGARGYRHFNDIYRSWRLWVPFMVTLWKAKHSINHGWHPDELPEKWDDAAEFSGFHGSG